MDQNQNKIIKTKILEEIKKTEGSIREYKELTKPISPENAIGRVSRMDAINNKSVNEASLRQVEQKLSTLKIALSKIDENDFGICAKCQKEIPIGRILIRPQSRLCVNCAN
ncbi:MAG: TraR/DksA family transcriptional regulator [Lutibacter sp.]|nr:MAG: TraR/DksA family transcriptional regulator [Lutibacter sp.]